MCVPCACSYCVFMRMLLLLLFMLSGLSVSGKPPHFFTCSFCICLIFRISGVCNRYVWRVLSHLLAVQARRSSSQRWARVRLRFLWAPQRCRCEPLHIGTVALGVGWCSSGEAVDVEGWAGGVGDGQWGSQAVGLASSGGSQALVARKQWGRALSAGSALYGIIGTRALVSTRRID